jgi:hypothetical protein
MSVLASPSGGARRSNSLGTGMTVMALVHGSLVAAVVVKPCANRTEGIDFPYPSGT